MRLTDTIIMIAIGKSNIWNRDELKKFRFTMIQFSVKQWGHSVRKKNISVQLTLHLHL